MSVVLSTFLWYVNNIYFVVWAVYKKIVKFYDLFQQWSVSNSMKLEIYFFDLYRVNW